MPAVFSASPDATAWEREVSRGKKNKSKMEKIKNALVCAKSLSLSSSITPTLIYRFYISFRFIDSLSIHKLPNRWLPRTPHTSVISISVRGEGVIFERERFIVTLHRYHQLHQRTAGSAKVRMPCKLGTAGTAENERVGAVSDKYR